VGYGTGAIMAVPAHDQRDFEFAKKYDLPIRIVIANPEEIGVKQSQNSQDESYTGEGVIINSGQWNGWKTPESNEKVTKWLEEKQFGKSSVNYHLRDWLISRQRYWGPPIPMVYCEVCAKEGKSWSTTKEVQSSKFKVQSSAWKADGWYPDENLPVLLPDIKDFRPSGSGKGPLVNHPDFYEITCPACGSKAIRETDVSDTFLDSAWYFLRYLATDRDDIPFPGKFQMSNFKCQISNEKKSDIGNLKLEIGNSAQRAAWLPVTSYIGGAEHAVLHLLYSRFITMVLNDLCYIGFEEPFTKFRTNGLIIKSGAKMSKSKGNVVNPDQYILKYGADTLRTYLGFIGPFSQGGDFQNAGIEGIFRFLNRIWKLVVNFIEEQSAEPRGKGTQKDAENSFSIVPRKILHSSASTSMMHKAIKGVTEDVEELRFNTAIAKIMTYYNFLSDEKENSKEEIETLLKLLAPFAPHITEELWLMIHADNKADSRRSRLNRDGSVKIRSSNLWKSIHLALWPTFDPAKIVSDTVTIAVQVNGKLRSTIILQMAKSKGQMEVEQAVKKLPNIQKYLEGKTIRKVIYVPGKIINFVV
jgi:leucyl-tRNA synthetase